MTANHTDPNKDQPNGHAHDEQEEHSLTEVSDLDLLRQDVERLTNEALEYKDKYVRAVAETENVRRRVERERSDLIKFGLEGFVKDLLPVLDSFDKAFPDEQPHANGGASNEQASYLEGMAMVKKQLLDTLKKHGVEVVKTKGAPFDPNVHQAIQRVEAHDVDQELVGEVYASGYLLHGRLVRPAMVSVVVPSK